jgi:class 3 adenylate cyclase
VESETHGFEIYKFIGDGWILFFPKTFPPTELFSFMKRLCDTYLAVFKSRIRPVASKSFDNGITFGLAEGSVVGFQMNLQDEYFGWPINLAARLQGAIGGKDDPAPQNKVLMTKSAYHDLRGEISRVYRIATVQRTLKNISGGESGKYIKLSLYEKAHPSH